MVRFLIILNYLYYLIIYFYRPDGISYEGEFRDGKQNGRGFKKW
jgi:hypothetical protein